MDNNKWKEWVGRMKSGDGLPGKTKLVILLLIGVILLIAAVPSEEKPKEEETERADSSYIVSREKYGEELERKTEKTLRKVQGAGEVTVMITFRSGGQKIVEKDQSGSSSKTEEADSVGGTRVSEDRSSEKTSIYEQASDGSQTPYVSKELVPEVEGVVVVADGGDNAVVVKNITEAVQALFGVEAHKIKIMKRADT